MNNFHLHFLGVQVYITVAILIQSHCYVLLAANLEDFKSIAKKLVPEELADQIADLATQSGVKFTQEHTFHADYLSGSEDETKRTAMLSPRTQQQTGIQLAKVNFEELVQKVKERIQRDLDLEKSRLTEVSNQERKKQKYDSREDRRVKIHRFVQERPKKTTKAQREPVFETEVDDTLADKQKDEPQYAIDDGMTFAKIGMQANDSYEDYVTPEKEKNVFETDIERKDVETTTFRETPKHIEKESPVEYDYEKTEELKAKTEDLWYDYNQKEVKSKETDGTAPMKTTKKNKGTMIPKRDFYKLSSPNYLAKVPIVAEKYDFNEPIPERDREPENLKPMKGVPPSIINGKIKLSDR